MAYWKRYRKCSAEAIAIAQCDSSSEGETDREFINEDNTGSGNLSSLELETFSNTCSATDKAEEDTASSLSHCENEVASCCELDSSNSCCSSFDETEYEIDINASSSPSSLREELATWATKHHCRRVPLNELLQILRKAGHCLPKDSRTLLATPRKITTSEKCGGKYIYFGIEHGVQEVLSKYPSFLENNKSIELMVNVDGLPLFKSSNAQFWPILGCFGGLDVFVIALFYGNAKPNSVEDYLSDFLEEIDKLKLSGLQLNSQKIKLDIKCFLCDAPARSFLKCIIGHTGYYACERCMMKGLWNGRIVYNCQEPCPLRTDEDFARLQYPEHQKSASPLIAHGISCVKRFPLDYMHLVCLGVVKRLLTFLKSGPKECRLSSGQILQISEHMMSLHGSTPSEFARQPRSLLELGRWKATEFRQFLLYTGLLVLRKVVSKQIYQHFLALSIGISIMVDSNTDRRNFYLQYARELIVHFVSKCSLLYGDTFVVYNVHSLIHLADDVEFFQTSLNDISCFPFENHMQTLKRLVRNAENPLVQVVKRLEELEHSKQVVPTSWHFTTVSATLKDSCFLLKNNKFAFVVEKQSDKTLSCDVISERHTESYFMSPADSKLFDIVLIRNRQRNAKRALVQKNDILRKCVCLLFDDGLLVLPVHHGVERR